MSPLLAGLIWLSYYWLSLIVPSSDVPHSGCPLSAIQFGYSIIVAPPPITSSPLTTFTQKLTTFIPTTTLAAHPSLTTPTFFQRPPPSPNPLQNLKYSVSHPHLHHLQQRPHQKRHPASQPTSPRTTFIRDYSNQPIFPKKSLGYNFPAQLNPFLGYFVGFAAVTETKRHHVRGIGEPFMGK